ncbi:MAG: hypothetical protein RL071_4345 [Pseudomonadota bacterium]
MSAGGPEREVVEAELRLVAEACARVGDLVGQADALARLAAVATAAGALAQAERLLDEAAGLADRPGGYGLRAQYLYGRARLLERLGDRAAADQALREAVGVAGALGERATWAKAQRQRAALAISGGDIPEGIAQLNVLLAFLGEHEAEIPEGAAELCSGLRLRSMLHVARGLPLAGLDDLDAAVEAARRAGDGRLQLQVRIERRALADQLKGEGAPEPWSALLSEAAASGDEGLRATAGLEAAAAALRGGQLAQALALASQARQSALDGDDPTRYLLACLLIAEGWEKLGQHGEVIEVLLTAKTSLEGLLGPEAGQGLRLILDSLPQRWGNEAFQAGLRRYRAKMAQQTPEA